MSNLNPTQMLPIGTMLDCRYEIVQYLASGGFGNTYVATDIKLGCRVAVKEFYLNQHSTRGTDRRSVAVTSPEGWQFFTHYREKFKIEARRISQLHSNHIVRVSDLFDDNGTSYYVMDFIEGQSLRRHIQIVGHLSDGNAIGICSQVLDALDVIHHAGLYHLDIKPDNIMLMPTGKVVLIDFGASKQMDAGGGAMLNSQMVYTPCYAPAEQLDGRFERIGPWTDFYALGATLYTMLTGSLPPTLSDITNDGYKAYRFLPSTSPFLKQCVMTMMCQSTKHRPQTIGDVRRLLSNKNRSAVGMAVESVNDESRIQTESQSSGSTQLMRGIQDRVFFVNGVFFKMIAIEGGTFMMGASREQGCDVQGDEKPAHQVKLSGYYLGETQVTQALWRAVMGYNPSCFKGEYLPVEQVSWVDCQQFIVRLNRLTKNQRPTRNEFRLPTEAEWEFAARGGNKCSFTKYAGSNDINTVAWYYGVSNTANSRWGSSIPIGMTQPVRQKKPNQLGLYDMSGNVWEWCQDSYDKFYYSKSPFMNPCNDFTTSYHVVRGGGWGNRAIYCRVAARNYGLSVGRNNNLGFRLAL